MALARAIVTNPDVLLLDEPLSALDRQLRQEMQVELRRIQRESGLTTIFVTHDQEEALTLSDRVAILDNGRIVQEGAPAEIYERPRTRFAASFLGDANFLAGRVVEGGVRVGASHCANLGCPAADRLDSDAGGPAGEADAACSGDTLRRRQHDAGAHPFDDLCRARPRPICSTGRMVWT